MNKAWDDLDRCSQALEKRILELGIVDPSKAAGGMLRLNVGGAPVNVRREALKGQKGILGCLFENAWDDKKVGLPRSADGHIVLDISPTCGKHVIHALARGAAAAGAAASGTATLEPLGVVGDGDGLPADEKVYLPFVSRCLELPTLGMPVMGGSRVMEPDEIGPMSATIRGWCPFTLGRVELIYRASRDGWSGEAFHARCGDDSPETITLYRTIGRRPGTGESIVGGFSSLPWTPTDSGWGYSHGAFVFMLKDGVVAASTPFQPAKWGLRLGMAHTAAVCTSGSGPAFGTEDMRLMSVNGVRMLLTSNSDYDIPDESSFLDLSTLEVTEVEVFRVCHHNTPPSPPPTANTAEASVGARGSVDVTGLAAAAEPTEDDRQDDIRSFGVSIADSLMEEKMALHQAHNELVQAQTRATASLKAVAAVYGPDVAAGKEDTVVELSVRGIRMTTLLSTLQACPDSALAARFDSETWPATAKDVDEHGRRLMDCSPSVFSKVLDVLRMRKREAWGSGDCGDRVAVKPADRAPFEEFVGMYFPGRESFIMDFVGRCPSDASKAGR